jgi:hypothetical protein
MKKQFLAERARALATVYLTRRKDLTLVEAKPDPRLDLHVYIDCEEKPMQLVFGVLLRAGFEPVTAEQADKLLGAAVDQFRKMGRFTYPVCLLYFTMRDDGAFFAWLAEPVVIGGGAPKLVHHTKADCRSLTNELLNQAVEQVVGWYNAPETLRVAAQRGGA